MKTVTKQESVDSRICVRRYSKEESTTHCDGREHANNDSDTQSQSKALDC